MSYNEKHMDQHMVAHLERILHDPKRSEKDKQLARRKLVWLGASYDATNEFRPDAQWPEE